MAIYYGLQNILEIEACHEQTQSVVIGGHGDADGFSTNKAAASARKATRSRARNTNTTQPKG